MAFEAYDPKTVLGGDAAYVILAERQNAPLATLDRDMKRVAKSLGVSLFQEYTPDSV